MEKTHKKTRSMRFIVWFVNLIFVAFIYSCSETEFYSYDNTTVKRKVSHVKTFDDAKIELESILRVVDGSETRSDGTLPRVIKGGYTFTKNTNMTRAEADSAPSVHIFNFEDDRGFAIMSGDDRLPPLIALSDSGKLDTTIVVDNPGLGIFLEGVDELVFNGDFMNDSLKTSIDDTYAGGMITYEYGPWEYNFYPERDGICDVKWDQNWPYNDKCPMVDGTHGSAGCVPIAVAQFMSANKYPESYNGTTFNWNEMNANPFINWVSHEAQDQIKTLIAELGKGGNLDVSYGAIESSASIDNIPRTLKNFGYSSWGMCKDYNIDDIVNELKNGYCVLLSGHSEKHKKKILGITVYTYYTGGHAWLGHGLFECKRDVKMYNGATSLGSYFQTSYYILCNYGWGGLYDGYYLSGAFNAKTNGVDVDTIMGNKAATRGGENNYQYNLKEVIGIRK